MIPADMRDEMQSGAPPVAPDVPAEAPPRRRKGMSQERIMITLTLAFFFGVLVCMYTDGIPRVIGLSLVTIVSYWIMFKGGA